MKVTDWNDPKNIVNWLDPHDHQHLHAYAYLQNTGIWPMGFVPEEIVLPPLWQLVLANKIAECWIRHVIGYGFTLD